MLGFYINEVPNFNEEFLRSVSYMYWRTVVLNAQLFSKTISTIEG